MGEVHMDIDANPLKMKRKMNEKSPTVRQISEKLKPLTPHERALQVFEGLSELGPVFDRIIVETNRSRLPGALGSVVVNSEGWQFDDGDEGSAYANPPEGNPKNSGPERLPLPTAA